MTRSGIADILPLSPLQEGLLFHALYDDDQAPDVYAAQQILELTGDVDPAAARAAAQFARQAPQPACLLPPP